MITFTVPLLKMNILEVFWFLAFEEFCFSNTIRLIGHKSDLHTKIK